MAGDELPLDVRVEALLEFLVTRNKLAKRWPAQLERIRSLVDKAARQNLPAQTLHAVRDRLSTDFAARWMSRSAASISRLKVELPSYAASVPCTC